MITWPGAEVAQ